MQFHFSRDEPADGEPVKHRLTWARLGSQSGGERRGEGDYLLLKNHIQKTGQLEVFKNIPIVLKELKQFSVNYESIHDVSTILIVKLITLAHDNILAPSVTYLESNI